MMLLKLLQNQQQIINIHEKLKDHLLIERLIETNDDSLIQSAILFCLTFKNIDQLKTKQL